MPKNNKKLGFVGKLAILMMGIPMFIIIISQTIIPHLIDVENYASNSEAFELTSYKYIDHKREKIGFGADRDVFTIDSNNTRYNLFFYDENKYDYYQSQLNSSELNNQKKYSSITLKLNPIELEKHQGNIEDPIPIFNFALKPNDYVWNKKTYDYNVQSYFVYEEILNIRHYSFLLYIMMGSGLVISIYSAFQAMLQTGRKAKELENIVNKS